MEEASIIVASPWITCFCVVKFDLEYGHTLEECQPEVSLPPEEQKNIAFLSFPDCNVNTSSDSLFTFRTRKGDRRLNQFHHGYAYFRQQKDETSSRGYLQKSIVVLSPLLHAHFFKRLIKLVGHLYFKRGPSVLATAVDDIRSWPEPEPGKSYELPLLGWVLRVQLPASPRSASPLFAPPTSAPCPSSSSSPASASTQLLVGSPPTSASPPRPSPSASAPSTTTTVPEALKGYSHEGAELFKGLGSALSHLWHLWELVLLNEPLVVEASDPSLTSDAVVSLTQLISPLSYCGDFRPYFTIHDRDYNEYAKAHPECLPGAIIGVTNPHFSHVLAHWPHTLHIGKSAPRVLVRKQAGDPRAQASTSTTTATAHKNNKPTTRSTATAVALGNSGPPASKPWRSSSVDGSSRSYSDSTLSDSHLHDDDDDSSSGDSGDDDGSGDDDDDDVDDHSPRKGSVPIPIINTNATTSSAASRSGRSSSSTTKGNTSFSFGGTRGVFDVLREKMSISRLPVKAGAGLSPDGRSPASPGRVGRSRSISSAHLPGSPAAHIHTKPQRNSTTNVDSKMKPLVVVNKRVLKQLLVPDRPGAYYNELIRRHFHRLTEVFLRPLEQYFASLVPAASTVSPFKPAPRIAAFSEDNFLKSLCRDDGAYLTGSASGDQLLYKRFLRSQNYYGWLQRRESEATTQLQRWYLRAFLSSKVPPILRRKAEIEIVDFYLLFQANMKKAEEGSMDAERVEACSEAILACLPSDLAQSILVQEKARAAQSALSGVEEDGSGGESGDNSD